MFEGSGGGGNRVLRSTRWREVQRVLRSKRWRAGDRMLRSTRWRAGDRVLRSMSWGDSDRMLRSNRWVRVTGCSGARGGGRVTGCSGACTRCGNGEDRCVALTVVGPLAPENAAERGFGSILSQDRGYDMFAIARLVVVLIGCSGAQGGGRVTGCSGTRGGGCATGCSGACDGEV